MSPLRKLTYFIKLVILDEIFIFRNSMIPEHQLVEKTENIAKRNFFDCVSFRSGLNHIKSTNLQKLTTTLALKLQRKRRVATTDPIVSRFSFVSFAPS